MRWSVVLTLLALLISSGAAAEVPGKKFRTDITFYRNSTPPRIQQISLITSTEETNFYHVNDADYILQLWNKSEIIFQGHLHISFKTIWDAGPNHTELPSAATHDTVRRTVRLPYYPEADRLLIRQNSSLLKNVSLPAHICHNDDGTCSSYCSGRQVDLDCTCGNGVCNPIETPTTCQPDCGAPPNDTTVENVDGEPEEETEQQRPFPVNPLPLAAILLTAGGLLYYLAREVEVQ